MRAFIALNLPNEIKDYLFDLQKHFPKDIKVKWVAKKHLHLTLKFLGEVTKEQIENIQNSLKTIEYPQQELTLKELGFFPNEFHPKVIWVDLEPEHYLLKLAQRVDEETLIFNKTEQKFKSHLTLGRVKQIKTKKYIEELKDFKIKPLKFTPTSFSLIKSTLTKDNPIYTVIEDYQLKETRS